MPSPHADSHYDDEIDLLDLVRVLIRRRYWILGGLVLAIAASTFYALSREPTFAFSTSIELGEFGPDAMVATSSAARNAVEDRIMLSAQRAFLEEEGLERMPFSVSTRAEEDSGFFNLVTEASLDQQPAVKRFHERIFNRLRDEHHSRLLIMKERSDAQIKTLEEAVENEERALAQLRDIRVQAAQQSENRAEDRPRAYSRSSAEGMRAGINSHDDSLTLLLGQLQVGEQIAEAEKRLNTLKSELREEESRRSWIRPTRADDFAMASLSPVGASRSLIVVLGVMLGGMLGLFLALMVELVSKARATPE